MTTLGWLKWLDYGGWPYFEWQYRKVIHKYLTTQWYLLQGGFDAESAALWREVMEVLELDRKARRDLFLLAQAGVPGRTFANKLLWDLLSGPALDPRYPEMSNLVSSQVMEYRRMFDRPPREHADLKHFWWSRLDDVYLAYLKPFKPKAVPNGPWTLLMGHGRDLGKPLPPPYCWGPGRSP